jgi:hypothetical protein
MKNSISSGVKCGIFGSPYLKIQKGEAAVKSLKITALILFN